MGEAPIAARPKMTAAEQSEASLAESFGKATTKTPYAGQEQARHLLPEQPKRGPGRPAMPETLKVIHGISRLLAGMDRDSKRQILETLLGIID